MTRIRETSKKHRCHQHNTTPIVVYAVPLHTPTNTTPAYRIAAPRRYRRATSVSIPVKLDNASRCLAIGYINQLTSTDDMVIGYGVIEPGSCSQITIEHIRNNHIHVQPVLSHDPPRRKPRLGWYINRWNLDEVVLAHSGGTSLWPSGTTSVRIGR